MNKDCVVYTDVHSLFKIISCDLLSLSRIHHIPITSNSRIMRRVPGCFQL